MIFIFLVKKHSWVSIEISLWCFPVLILFVHRNRCMIMTSSCRFINGSPPLNGSFVIRIQWIQPSFARKSNNVSIPSTGLLFWKQKMQTNGIFSISKIVLIPLAVLLFLKYYYKERQKTINKGGVLIPLAGLLFWKWKSDGMLGAAFGLNPLNGSFVLKILSANSFILDLLDRAS